MQKRMWLLLAALLAFAIPAAAQQRQISGRVTGPDGAPLAGASVAIAGTTRGVRTDQEGNYSIAVPAGDARLFASRVGYVGRMLVVPAAQSSANFRLETDVLQLEGVVVTGQATSVAKRNLANAVATVSAADVARAPTQSVDRALAGKIVGANITSNSGAPGGGIQVRLRGVSSINASAEPLWVIDGIVMSNAAIPPGTNAVTRASSGFDASNQDNATNRVSDLNPADIESIEVLKGASAAAIYGSKASNGVIIVTTKRGREGAPLVSISQRFGVSQLSNTLGSRNFTRAEAIAQYDPKGLGKAAFDPDLYFNADGTPKATFDHEEELAGRHPVAAETEMSVSGGNGGTRYYASGLVQNDPGIIANTGFQKQSFRVNLDQKVGGRVDLGFSTNLMHSVASRGLTNNDNTNSSFYVALSGTPNFVDLRGTPTLGYPRNPFNSSNPLQTSALMRNDESTWRFTGAATAKVDVYHSDTQSLRLLGTGGADYFQQKNDLFFPPVLQFEPDDGLPGTVVAGDGDNLNLNGNLNLVHTYSVSALTATTSAGAQYEDRDQNVLRSVGLGLPSGLDRVDAAQSKLIFPRRERVRDWGLFAQEELTLFDSRLLLTGGIRADKSSANGDPDQYFYYPKAAASFRFSDLLGGRVDELKLRTAYGETGNQPLFGQQFTELSASSTISGFPALGVPIGTLAVAGAKDIHPEREKEIEGGIDATMLGGRATLELTGYRKHISDLILQRAIAPSSGYVTQIKNGGDMVTKGFEAALAATPVQGSFMTWVSRATFYRTRSTITDLPVPTFRPVGVQFTSVGLGAFQIEKGKSSTQIVGNKVGADGQVHVVQLGDATPDFNMSFTNELTHGPFRAYALLDWQHGGDVINLTRLLYDAGGVSEDYDLPKGVSAPRDIPDCIDAKPACSGLERISGFGSYTEQYIEDASFVKLREVSLTYSLPRSLTGHFWHSAGGADLTVSGRNLWTHTHYSGLDPEVSNFGSQQITRGIDVAPFPPSRSWWVALNLRF